MSRYRIRLCRDSRGKCSFANHKNLFATHKKFAVVRDGKSRSRENCNYLESEIDGIFSLSRWLMRAVLISAVKTRSKPRRGESINLAASQRIPLPVSDVCHIGRWIAFPPIHRVAAGIAPLWKIISRLRRVWQRHGTTITTVYPSTHHLESIHPSFPTSIILPTSWFSSDLNCFDGMPPCLYCSFSAT